MKRGIYVLVVGPSGSGKDTLIHAAREAYPNLSVAVSATTRTPREGEVNGVDYHFLTPEEFARRVEANEFLEWAEYGGNRYGTLRIEIEPRLETGRLILSDIEVQGARQIREKLPKEEFASIYIDAGSWEALAARIHARAPMTDEEFEKRRARYEDESTFKTEATYVVTNCDGGLEDAKKDFIRIIGELSG